MIERNVITTICPECDEAFCFIETSLPCNKQCPHCRKQIEIKKVVYEETES